MNRQARVKGGDEWRDYGNVTHSEAVRNHALWFSGGLPAVVEIETRDQAVGCVHEHIVTLELTCKVQSLRHDAVEVTP